MSKQAESKTINEALKLTGIGQFNVLRAAVQRHAKLPDPKDKELVKVAIGDLRKLMAEAVEKGKGDITLEQLLTGKEVKAKEVKEVKAKEVKERTPTKKKKRKKAAKPTSVGGDVVIMPTGISKAISKLGEDKEGLVVLAPVDLMVPTPWHPRFDKGDLNNYAKFIGAFADGFESVMDPLVGIVCYTKERTAIEVVDGMRTALAFQLARDKGYLPKVGRVFLPMRILHVVKAGEDSSAYQQAKRDALRLQAYKATSKNLHPAEIASLITTAVTAEDAIELKEIAGYLGLTQTRARELLLLASASDDVRAALERGDIAVSDVSTLLKGCKGNHKEQNARLKLALVNAAGAGEPDKPQTTRKRVTLNTSVLKGGSAINERQARAMLNSLATQYSRFRRGGLGRRQESEEWDVLDKLLVQIRNLKAAGRIST